MDEVALTDLPFSVLGRIFSFLPVDSLLLDVLRSCSEFRHAALVSPTLFAHVHVSKSTLGRLESDFRFFDLACLYVRQIYVLRYEWSRERSSDDKILEDDEGVSAVQLSRFLKYSCFGSLTDCTFKGSCLLDLEVLRTLLHSCECLQCLTIDGCLVSDEDRQGFDFEFRAEHRFSHLSLSTLSIVNCGFHLADASAIQIVAACPFLRSVSFQGSFISDATLRALSSSCSVLEVVRAGVFPPDSSGRITDRGVSALASGVFQGLVELAITNCPRVSSVSIASVMQAFSDTLEAIQVTGSNEFPEFDLQQNCVFPRLLSIDFSSTLLSDAVLVTLSDRLPHLEVVSIFGCGLVTDSGLSCLIRECGAHLRILDLDHCDCTDEICRIVAISCPRLEKLVLGKGSAYRSQPLSDDSLLALLNYHASGYCLNSESLTTLWVRGALLSSGVVARTLSVFRRLQSFSCGNSKTLCSFSDVPEISTVEWVRCSGMSGSSSFPFQVLHLDSLPLLMSSDLYWLVQKSPMVRSLSLSRTKVSGRIFPLLCRSCPFIDTLNLCGCDFLSEDLSKGDDLWMLPFVTAMYLVGSPLSCDDIAFICARCPKLERMDATFADHLNTIEDLEAIQKSFPFVKFTDKD